MNVTRRRCIFLGILVALHVVPIADVVSPWSIDSPALRWPIVQILTIQPHLFALWAAFGNNRPIRQFITAFASFTLVNTLMLILGLFGIVWIELALSIAEFV